MSTNRAWLQRSTHASASNWYSYWHILALWLLTHRQKVTRTWSCRNFLLSKVFQSPHLRICQILLSHYTNVFFESLSMDAQLNWVIDTVLMQAVELQLHFYQLVKSFMSMCIQKRWWWCRTRCLKMSHKTRENFKHRWFFSIAFLFEHDEL